MIIEHVMERVAFRTWLVQMDDLITVQRLEFAKILAELPPRAAVAVDRGGDVISAVLQAGAGDAIKVGLEPVLGKDALRIADGGKALVRCAAKNR